MSLNQIEIYKGEIWTKSGCLDFENTFVKMVEQMLQMAGYQRTDQYLAWQKQQRRVYIAVVDDVVRFSRDYDQAAVDQMTPNDLLITDNWISKPTQADICQLPHSWFGIYGYVPDSVDPDIPVRDFGLCVNRIDAERLSVFCELDRICDIEQELYGNVNCEAHDRNLSDQDRQQEFARIFYSSLAATTRSACSASFNRLKTQIPFRNHSLTVEQVHAASRVNIIMETYCQDHTVALSEKIFRALVTARPWVVYAGRYAVARIKQLGFDVLDDVVDHARYDHLTSRDLTKYQILVNVAKQTLDAHPDSVEFQNRLARAAKHNQQLLAHYRSQLALDIGTWFRDFAQKL